MIESNEADVRGDSSHHRCRGLQRLASTPPHPCLGSRSQSGAPGVQRQTVKWRVVGPVSADHVMQSAFDMAWTLPRNTEEEQQQRHLLGTAVQYLVYCAGHALTQILVWYLLDVGAVLRKVPLPTFCMTHT